MVSEYKVIQTEIEIDILYEEMGRVQAERAALDIEYERLRSGIVALKDSITDIEVE